MVALQWKDVVKQVGKENPGLKLSEILKLASPIYKKQKANSSGVISTTQPSSLKKSSVSRKSRKSKKSSSISSSSGLETKKKLKRKSKKRKMRKTSTSRVVIV